MTCEVLSFSPQSQRASATLAAFARSPAPRWLTARTATTTYRGGADWLLLWGPGATNRFEPMRQQLAAGGHVLALDLAYWQRDRKVRVSIDAAHPQAWVMRADRPADRWQADRMTVTDGWNPDGPVLLAGIGEKARVQYGDAVDTWEARQIAECRVRGLVVHVRPKRGATVPIERALAGASLVITWHSNVAVDAIRLGIPVVCRDGAAAAVCPAQLPNDPHPLPVEVRDQFLANLSWYQWDLAREADACWRFLQETLA